MHTEPTFNEYDIDPISRNLSAYVGNYKLSAAKINDCFSKPVLICRLWLSPIYIYCTIASNCEYRRLVSYSA